MKSITVFCGSSFGTEEIYKQQAVLLGQTLAKQNIKLIYGGANVGLMGAVADGVLNSGGEAIGVLPDFLRSKEIAHLGLTELILVESMHERKTKMNDLCDGVIALPGGFGTLEELFEIRFTQKTNRYFKHQWILRFSDRINEIYGRKRFVERCKSTDAFGKR